MSRYRKHDCISRRIVPIGWYNIHYHRLGLALLHSRCDLSHQLRSIPQIIDLGPSWVTQCTDILSLLDSLDHLDVFDHWAADLEAHLDTSLVDDITEGECGVNPTTTDAHQYAGKGGGVCL